MGMGEPKQREALTLIEHIPLNCPLDELLGGGLPRGMITQIYGPPGSGKSNLAMQAMINATRMGKKVLFIDTEGSLVLRRLEQMQPTKECLENTILMEPSSLAEQAKCIETAWSVKDLGLVIVDSMVYHYRLEFNKEHLHKANRELGMQMATLLDLARKMGIPVMVTNHVYGNPETRTNEAVGGDVMRYASKVIVELTNGSAREARLIKHAFAKEGKKVEFHVVGKGVI